MNFQGNNQGQQQGGYQQQGQQKDCDFFIRTKTMTNGSTGEKFGSLSGYSKEAGLIYKVKPTKALVEWLNAAGLDFSQIEDAALFRVYIENYTPKNQNQTGAYPNQQNQGGGFGGGQQQQQQAPQQQQYQQPQQPVPMQQGTPGQFGQAGNVGGSFPPNTQQQQAPIQQNDPRLNDIPFDFGGNQPATFN